ncbi:S9 family peptidase [Saccharicrinis sp. 156]|uniref:S9 family peptidase n=1 Tax=Saccharicrinis sp. 156 TaxID=3417574 RepID=UPI003D338698
MIPHQLPQAPMAEKKDSAITFHNHTRIDPYFWMRLTDEQKNAQSPDEQTQKVLDYLNAENAYTDTVMQNTKQLQENLFHEIVGRIKKDDESVPYFSNGYWYYVRYEEGKEYPIFCRKKDSLDNPENIFLNVNELAEGHEYYAIGSLTVSLDNKLLAFTEDKVSRRIYSIRFKNLDTGDIIKDEIPNVSAGGAWANDNQTFFYTTKNKVSLLSEKIWRHKLGNDISKDVMVYHEKDPSFYISVTKSKSDKYIIIGESSTLVSDYHILNANHPTGEFKQFTPRGTEHEYSISHFEDKFFIVTNHKAQNFRLMETTEDATDISNWKEVIPHRKDVLLEGIDIFKNHLVLSERKNALNHLRIINQKTKEQHYLEFGEEVYVAGTTTNPEFDTEILRYSYSSMTTPYSTIDYNMNSKTKDVKKVSEVVGGHTPENYHTERQWAHARDGVQVPISIVYKKGTKLDGTAPLLLYAYGSYGATMDPGFSSTRLSLLDRGFVFAIAHIRGGQSMGRQWYEDGKMMKKINTFNDYIDCSKFLIEKKYTSPDHLYAMGGSAGGLLMGAIVNMEPQLYNGVIAAVPFVDVISTMLDETIPLTTNEFDEWGNPKNKEAYDYMLKYSPYDNVKAQEYPNMLITTGLFDSQVQYWEPAKWLAKLRDTKTDNNLLIMHTNMEAGHGGASGRFKRYRETALEYSFMFMLEGITE